MQVYIIHGFSANPSKHWFSWLKSELEKDGISTKVLTMPNPNEPVLNEWIQTLQNEIELNKDTYLVGHSLGCITSLRYLQGEKQDLGGIVLVSGFYEKLKILPQLDAFVKDELDFKALIKRIDKRIVISAKNDTIVPTNLSINLANKLEATLIQTDTGGHFMQEEGVRTMPWVLASLWQMKIK